MSNKILITGGAGYVGLHITDLLLRNGFLVKVFDTSINKNYFKTKRPNLELIEGNILNYDQLRNSMKNINTVIHLAAKKSVKESSEIPNEYFLNNLTGTINVISAMKDENVKRILFSSTASVYAETENDYIYESDLRTPKSIYGLTKFLAENFIINECIKLDFTYAIFRYFNVGGSADPIMADQSNDNLLPKIFKAIKLKNPISVYGTDYRTRDGTCIRDYVHVSDVAAAHLSALYALTKKNDSFIYNIGSGTGCSVLEIISAIGNVIGTDVDYIKAPRRNGDPARLVASNSKIYRELNWEPQFTINQIIESAWEGSNYLF